MKIHEEYKFNQIEEDEEKKEKFWLATLWDIQINTIQEIQKLILATQRKPPKGQKII